ncbi:MAG: 4Fe-4S binding protein, partial [Deltaproteobacteria bacterium]|nr:4Fe-4S binding protein [Deltaproteobacteria bacterium]
ITEDKCAGCGYCEHQCPVQNKAAIIVTPMGGLRMAEGSFKEEGMKLGMNISIKSKDETGYPSDEDPSYGTAPGFDAYFSESAELGFDDPYSDVDEPEDGQVPGFDAE